MKRSWSVAAYLFLVFASGVLVGAFAHRVYSTTPVIANERPPRPEDYRVKFVAEHERRLQLSAGQVEQLNAILDITGARVRELRERSRPEMRQIQQEQRDKILAILNPEQQSEYVKMLDEREKERRRRGGPPGH